MNSLRVMTTSKAAVAVVSVCLFLAACEPTARDPLKLEDQGKLLGCRQRDRRLLT